MKINGLKVVDATKRKVLKVTQKDITEGNTKDPGACAAARACVRQHLCTEARVHLGRIYLKIGNKWERYLRPRSMRTEIVAFDRGAKFAEGEFLLSPLGPAERKSRGKARGTATNKNSKRTKQKQRPKYHVVTGVRPYGANR